MKNAGAVVWPLVLAVATLVIGPGHVYGWYDTKSTYEDLHNFAETLKSEAEDGDTTTLRNEHEEADEDTVCDFVQACSGLCNLLIRSNIDASKNF